MTSFNIKDLSDLIKKNIPKEKITLVAEVREPKLRGGNMYLTLKDDNGYINCIIWKSNITDEISSLKGGSKIKVIGNLNFYQNRCSLSFVISKLLSIEGKGELMEKYDKTFKYYNDKGYFLESKKIKPPKIIKKILILTSKEGAAIQDFYYGIDNGGIKIEQELVNVIVQGNDCPSNIIKYLEENIIDKDLDYDMIVLTRGGGSFEDLFGFCKPELIECISKLKIPLLSAIGHQVDTTLVDYIADIVAPTPSLGAQFIVDHNKKYVDELKYIKLSLQEQIKDDINEQNIILNNYKNKLSLLYENLKDYFYKKIKDSINNNKIEMYKIKTKYQSNNNIIISNNKIINDDINFENILKNDKMFSIIINKKVFNFSNYTFNIK
jgi:exodeoxyribonuclease VII large subunit